MCYNVIVKISPQQSNFQVSCWRTSITCPGSLRGGCIMNVSGVSEVIIRRKRSTQECYFSCRTYCLRGCGWTERSVCCVAVEICFYSSLTSFNIYTEMAFKHHCTKKKQQQGITVCVWFNSSECGPWKLALQRTLSPHWTCSSSSSSLR